MAAAPRGPLTNAERAALKARIAEASAAKGVAADKAKYGSKHPTSGRLVKDTPEYTPRKVRAGNTTVRTKTRTDTVVQGATTSEAQRKAAQQALEARRAARTSRAATPQAEKPKNSNYKPKPKAPAKEKPKTYYADALAAIRKEYADRAAAADKRKNPKAPANKQKVNSPAEKKKAPATPKPKAPIKGRKQTNSQPGPGANTGGTGRDADGGKGRTSFEDDRRQGMAGQGGNRPPVYRPQDDGQRGGYINRSTKGKGGGTINTGGPAKGPVRPPKPPVIPAKGNGGVLRTDTRTIVPAKPKKKLPPTTGSSVVKGLIR